MRNKIRQKTVEIVVGVKSSGFVIVIEEEGVKGETFFVKLRQELFTYPCKATYFLPSTNQNSGF